MKQTMSEIITKAQTTMIDICGKSRALAYNS